MVTREEILEKVNKLLKQLSGPLSQSEMDNGWNDEIKSFWLGFFQRMKNDLESNVPISKRLEYTQIGRGLDSNGIIDGELLEDAVTISVCMRRLGETEIKWWSLKNKKTSRCLKYLFFIFLFVLLTVKFCWIDFWKIPQNGMYPTIPSSKRFLCKRNPYKTVSDIKRGDIIVFKAEWKDGKEYDFTWRVIGLPGDSIIIQDKQIIINGSDLKREKISEDGDYVIYKETNGQAIYDVAYLKEHDSKNLENIKYDVSENHVFVLGDNRDNASDSREIGTVPFDSIIAKKL